MALPSRPGFVYLIMLFLKRMPAVWLGGVAAAVVLLALATEMGPRAAAAGVLVVVAASVGAEFAVDRRRGVGRRLLFRGTRVSPRRVLALVVALGVIASIATALTATMVNTIRTGITDEVRGRSSPNQKRGFY